MADEMKSTALSSVAQQGDFLHAASSSASLEAGQESRLTKALLLAGGSGIRLRPLTQGRNKHMIPLANQPMIFYALAHLSRAGVREVGVVLGRCHDELTQAIGDGDRFGLEVTYVDQGDPRGLADAVRCGQEFLGDDPFLMYLGDNLLQEGVAPLVDLYRRLRPDAVIAVTEVPEPSHYGVVELDAGRIVSIEEKPLQPRSNLALVGTYLFSPSVHEVIAHLEPSARGELEITDALRILHRTGCKIAVHRLRGWWKDAGRPSDLLYANEEILKMMPPEAFAHNGAIGPSGESDGSVALGDGSAVSTHSRICGPTVIGRDVQIADGATVGSYCAIGDGCAVRAATVSRSILMEGAQVIGPLRVSDSVIGRNARITARQPIHEPVSLTVGDSASIEL